MADGNERLNVHVRMANTDINALADTGAQVSIMSSELASKLGLCPTPSSKRLVTANGERLKHDGTVIVQLDVGPNKVKLPLFVVPRIQA